MRALVVVPFPLHFEGGAAARCTIGLLRGLEAHGVQAHALSADARSVPSTEPPAGLDIEVVRFEYPSPLRDRWQRLVEPYGGLARGPFASRLRECAREVDVVHIIGVYSGSLLPLVTPPAVVQLDCVTRRDRDIGAPWRRESRIAIELLRAERRTCRRARWLLANSPEIAVPLARQAPQAEVVTAPLSLDADYYAPPASLANPTVGLIGTAWWPPTADAVSRLLSSLWPRIVERRPDARLLLAGLGMERASFPDLPTLPGVEWLGAVESATEFLRGLGLLLYPLGRGSGAKIKVLEALALGVPVLTTALGAEGIVGRGGLIVESSDGELAEATVALLEDEVARRQVGEAGRATFLAHHAPEPAADRVVRLYERMIGGARPASAGSAGPAAQPRTPFKLRRRP